ncbi:guanine nucleotide-binding protein G(I)/G(S)/G(O) subunit gamma-11-like isoform X2 [Vombatus ursinus]|nr:guanine nucleotide-binding protein G(I)/G(S)/G(O) subunit gamma-11-like isoform X2 [Vombatus ursinus]
MPAVHVEDLSEKDKLKMEVAQLRKEAKLQRQQNEITLGKCCGLPSAHGGLLGTGWEGWPECPAQAKSPHSVSKCSEEIKKYIEARCGEDPLVKGIPEDKNPYKEKAGCTIS